MVNLLTSVNYLLKEQPTVSYKIASTGQRFLNYLIDDIVLRFGIGYAIGQAIGYHIAKINPGIMHRIFDAAQYPVILYGIGYLFLYYTLCEKVFGGYTLGKLITGTKAIRKDGLKLTFKDALLRSLTRAFPFEVFTESNGYFFHDAWTKTMVVKTR